MKFGFCVMSDIDEIGFFSFVETLGYHSVWVADSQMMFSDVYMVCALAAQQTQRLRIGPGTAICGTRIPPVQVAAIATLNRMAPGRVFLGIGTGNTAMRTMGQKPMKMAAFGRLSAGADGAAGRRGGGLHLRGPDPADKDAAARHEVHEPAAAHPAVCFRVRAAGDGAGRRIRRRAGVHHPAARRADAGGAGPCAARRGPQRPRHERLPQRRADQHRAAGTRGAADSDRIKLAIGPNVMASVYYFYDMVQERGIEPPAFLERIWKPYCALVEADSARAPAFPHA